MQATSELWKTLFKMNGTERQYAFEINGVWYGPDSEVEHSSENGLYESFGIGNAYSATLSLGLFADDVPRGATIKRFVRLVNEDQASEWIPKGTFFINTRAEDDGYWSITAFDAMRRAEIVWEPEQALEFPLPMSEAVDEFCRLMGVELDERTALNSAYTIDYPANDYTIKNELSFIAAAHAGNWIITDEGKLYLVPLLSAPAETNYLVTEHGDSIVFGGVRIIV